MASLLDSLSNARLLRLLDDFAEVCKAHPEANEETSSVTIEAGERREVWPVAVVRAVLLARAERGGVRLH